MEIFWPLSFPTTMKSDDYALGPPNLTETVNTDSKFPRQRQVASRGITRFTGTFEPLSRALMLQMKEFLETHQARAFWLPDPMDETARYIKVSVQPTSQENLVDIKHLGENKGWSLTAKFGQWPLAYRTGVWGYYDGQMTWTDNLLGNTNTGIITSNLAGVITLKSDSLVGFIKSLANGAAFTRGTHYTISNLPSQFTPRLVKKDAKHIELSFTGSALNTTSIPGVSLALLNAAFEGALVASSVQNSVHLFNIAFVPIYAANLSWQNSLVGISGTRAVTGALVGTLTSTTVQPVTFYSGISLNGYLVRGTHYTVSGVPAGLTERITKISASTVRMVLTGAAANSNAANITVSFTNAAFTGAVAANVRGTPIANIPLSFDAQINAPQILSPLNGSTNVNLDTSIFVSPFSAQGAEDTLLVRQIQVARDFNFYNVVTEYSGPEIQVWVPPAELPHNTLLYCRARDIGAVLGASSWSATTSFATLEIILQYIEQPTIIRPVQNATDVNLTPSIQISEFTAVNATDVPSATRGQIATDAGFINIVHDSGWAAYTTEYELPEEYALAQSTTYYIRAAHMGQSLGVSEWSEPTKFTTFRKYVETPVILSQSYPMWGDFTMWGERHWMGGASDVSLTPTILLTAFTPVNATDVPNGTRGQISTHPSFANITHDTGWQPYTTSYQVPESSKLSQTTQYFVRFMHRGAVLGESAWSAASFITEEDS